MFLNYSNNLSMKHYASILFYIFLNVALYLFQASLWVYFFVFILFLALIIWGASNIQLNYFVKNINFKQTQKKEVALTFDDGPTEFTPLFLELLKENDIKATFFCIGKQIEKFPEIFQQIIADGHTIGNHTYSHSNKTGMFSTSQMQEEIQKCDDIIKIFGQIKTKLYRPPFGVTNPNIARAISKTEKTSIGWNNRSFDTSQDSQNKIVKRITNQLKKGNIILMHDTSEKSFHVLEDLLLILQRDGYSTFTIDQLIKNKND